MFGLFGVRFARQKSGCSGGSESTIANRKCWQAFGNQATEKCWHRRYQSYAKQITVQH